jgi:hypothetical protein
VVRSLYREDRLPQPEIARRMNRHKSWVWRRLMLVEALDPLVQTDVRLGLIAPRAAVAVSRLPRGNQQAASAVVVRRGLTVRQTEVLVDDALAQQDPTVREALPARRLDGPAISKPPGPRPARPTRSDADWISLDILRVHEIAARLEARLLSTPLEVFAPPAAALMRDALARLSPVLPRARWSHHYRHDAGRGGMTSTWRSRGARAPGHPAREAGRVAARDLPRRRRQPQHRPHAARGARTGPRHRARRDHATPDARAACREDRRMAVAGRRADGAIRRHHRAASVQDPARRGLRWWLHRR